MKIEEAKLILSSFRPDGMDAQDQEFTEALQLAVVNRELGEWLSDERAFDAQFVDALNAIEISPTLRQEIMESITGEVVMAEDPELDQMLYEVLAVPQPPIGLKEQILTAMEREVEVAKVTVPFYKRLWVPALVACLLAICSMVLLLKNNLSNGVIVVDNVIEDKNFDSPLLNAKEIQKRIGVQLASNELKLVSNNYNDSMSWLRNKKLPTFEMPDSLRDMECVGCSSVNIGDGKEGSIVSFKSSNGKIVNVLVIADQYIKDKDLLPDCIIGCREDSYFCKKCQYWIARMKSNDAVVMFLSEMDKEETLSLF